MSVTLATAKAAYLDNADWKDGGGDITKARAFRTACTQLIVFMPTQGQQGSISLGFSIRSIMDSKKAVDAWLSSQEDEIGTTLSGRQTYTDYSTYRS